MNILILIRLDVIITNVVDNLLRAIENTEKVILQIIQDDFTVGTKSEELDSASKEKVCTRGDIMPQRYEEKLKSMLPLVSAQLLKYCHEIFVKHCKRNNIDIKNELSPSGDGNGYNSIDNTSRKNHYAQVPCIWSIQCLLEISILYETHLLLKF